MRVESDDVFARRDSERDVEASGLDAAGVVDEANAWIGLREIEDDLASAVGGPAVDDEDLPQLGVSRNVEGAHGLEARTNEVTFLEARNENGNRIHGRGR